MVRAQCSSCGTQYKIPDEMAGKMAKCKKCGQAISIPAAETSIPPGSEKETIKYACPQCKGKLENPGTMGGRQDKCPLCGCLHPVPLSKGQQKAIEQRNILESKAANTPAIPQPREVKKIATQAQQDALNSLANAAAQSPQGSMARSSLSRFVPSLTRKKNTNNVPNMDYFGIGCPSCHRALSVPTWQLGCKQECPFCNHIFDTLPKEEIERKRKSAPPHKWLVIKESGEEFTAQGIDTIRNAISDGTISPTDYVVDGPFLPAMSVRVLAGQEKKFKKLYDPLPVFADRWSYLLVVLIPILLIFLIAVNSTGESAISVFCGSALTWLLILGILIAVVILSTLLTVLMSSFPVFGSVIVALVTGGFIGYIALLVAAIIAVFILTMLQKAMRPLARAIGRVVGVERKRISNWQQWMQSV